MEQRIKSLKAEGDYLFGQRGSLMTLWQEIAENFYPERADFTTTRVLGDEFAEHLMTASPVLARRDLASAIGTMLRPRGKEWFFMAAEDEEGVDHAGKQWYEMATRVQRRAMYDRSAKLARATKEGDNDYAAFGQTVISNEVDWDHLSLIYRCWHLKDVVWKEDILGDVAAVHRKWKMPATEMVRRFKDSVHSKVEELSKGNRPYTEVRCRHVIVRAEDYDAPVGKPWNTPYVSIYFDEEHEGQILEEVGVFNKMYVIPRWQTVAGSQYAYSPSTVAALADARQIQSMTRVLIEAGEKAVDPPMVATQEAVRSDIQIFAGGITWVDDEYDEKLGQALRPISQDRTALPLGLEMQQDVRGMIHEAFYLNKLTLPVQTGDMTATEVSQRIEEYVRSAMPIFEPMEEEYNGELCEITFDNLMRAHTFGDPRNIPDSIKGKKMQFKFESPLHESADRVKGQRFLETKQMLAEAAELDAGATNIVDARESLRDALEGIGVPAEWMRSEDDVEAMDREQQQQQQASQAMQMLEQGGAAAEQVGRGGEAIAGLGEAA